MTRRPASNLSACCAVSQSGQAICERSGHSSATAIMIATPNTARVRSWLSQILPEPRSQPSRHPALRSNPKPSANGRISRRFGPNRRIYSIVAMPTKIYLVVRTRPNRKTSMYQPHYLPANAQRHMRTPQYRKTLNRVAALPSVRRAYEREWNEIC